jgi:hypothetical protein
MAALSTSWNSHEMRDFEATAVGIAADPVVAGARFKRMQALFAMRGRLVDQPLVLSRRRTRRDGTRKVLEKCIPRDVTLSSSTPRSDRRQRLLHVNRNTEANVSRARALTETRTAATRADRLQLLGHLLTVLAPGSSSR